MQKEKESWIGHVRPSIQNVTSTAGLEDLNCRNSMRLHNAIIGTKRVRFPGNLIWTNTQLRMISS